LPHNIPQSLKVLYFGESYNHVLPEILPQSLEEIDLGRNYNLPFQKIYHNH